MGKKRKKKERKRGKCPRESLYLRQVEPALCPSLVFVSAGLVLPCERGSEPR